MHTYFLKTIKKLLDQGVCEQFLCAGGTLILKDHISEIFLNIHLQILKL